MKYKGLVIKIIISVTFISLAYIFLKPVFNYLSGFLSKSEQVKANILVVEGWLPDYALELAYKEYQKKEYDHIITTGLKSSNEYSRISANGYMIYYLRNKTSETGVSGTHTIEVDAFSELGGDNRAHFNLYINNLIIADFLSVHRKKKYKVKWEGYLEEIDSIMIQFDNDRWGELGDRNLFIKEINIDHKITVPNLNNHDYNILESDGKRKIINNYISNASRAKNQLMILGIDSSLITAVWGKKVRINRTLTSALAFRDWLKTSDIEIKGINVISMGTHARRTWMTYNKILDKKYKIGIISLPDTKTSNSKTERILRTIRETFGIIYYWFILIPF
jgi:hypothetical protein